MVESGAKEVTIELPARLVEQAEELGLDVQKYCRNRLENGINSLGSAPAWRDPGRPLQPRDEGPGKPSPSGRKSPDEQGVGGFLRDFRETCRVDWSLADSTIRERVRYARKLVDFIDKHPLEAEKEELRDFVTKYDDDNAIKTVRVIYGRYFDSDIADSFKVPQSPVKPKEIPGKEVLRGTFGNLESIEIKTAFLMWASSGLRRGELLGLTLENIDLEQRMLRPDRITSTKKSWVSFYNSEAEERLQALIDEKGGNELFTYHPDYYTERIREASNGAVTPQKLRDWFSEEMSRLGIPERYVDAFAGRTPRSVLGRHYSDYRPAKMKEKYESVDLKVLE